MKKSLLISLMGGFLLTAANAKEDDLRIRVASAVYCHANAHLDHALAKAAEITFSNETFDVKGRYVFQNDESGDSLDATSWKELIKDLISRDGGYMDPSEEQVEESKKKIKDLLEQKIILVSKQDGKDYKIQMLDRPALRKHWKEEVLKTANKALEEKDFETLRRIGHEETIWNVDDLGEGFGQFGPGQESWKKLEEYCKKK
jgi:hypothetical protein